MIAASKLNVLAGVLAALGLLAACGSAQQRPTAQHIAPKVVAATVSHVQVELTSSPPLFRGALGSVEPDEANAGVLYPGGHPAAFLLGVAIHGSIVAGQKSSEASAAQTSADAVLGKWSSAITGLNIESALAGAAGLAQQTLPITVSTVGATVTGIDEAPLRLYLSTEFTVAQDSRTLTARTLVQVRSLDLSPDIARVAAPSMRSVKHLGGRVEPLDHAHSAAANSADSFAYQNVVEVMSVPRQATTAAEDISPKALQDLVTGLWEQTLVLAVDDLVGSQKDIQAPQQTFRYFRDGKKQFDRGTLIKDSGDRVSFRTLRGWIRSVPTSPEA
ncbi:hypothetical protein [Allohahella marinimesophila]|uniref:Uncharacterized protein n=1 Tax=Allohahella marinimesophila TaxID=1054972 RepID=A0ABP7NS80_9GAMM